MNGNTVRKYVAELEETVERIRIRKKPDANEKHPV